MATRSSTVSGVVQESRHRSSWCGVAECWASMASAVANPGYRPHDADALELARRGLRTEFAASGDPIVEVSGRAYCALRWIDGEHPHGTALTTAQARHLGVTAAQLHQALASLPAAYLPLPLPAPDSRLTTAGAALTDCDRCMQIIGQIIAPSAFDTEVAALIRERRNLITACATHRPADVIPSQPDGPTATCSTAT